MNANPLANQMAVTGFADTKEQCRLQVLVRPGEEPIRCRRSVWASGVCLSCHPWGREQFVEGVIRRYLRDPFPFSRRAPQKE